MYLFGIWNSALCNHLVLLWGDVLFGRLGLTLVEFWPLTRLSNSAGEPRFGLALLVRGQLPWNAKAFEMMLQVRIVPMSKGDRELTPYLSHVRK
jgi:hypothetical protein